MTLLESLADQIQLADQLLEIRGQVRSVEALPAHWLPAIREAVTDLNAVNREVDGQLLEMQTIGRSRLMSVGVPAWVDGRGRVRTWKRSSSQRYAQYRADVMDFIRWGLILGSLGERPHFTTGAPQWTALTEAEAMVPDDVRVIHRPPSHPNARCTLNIGDLVTDQTSNVEDVVRAVAAAQARMVDSLAIRDRRADYVADRARDDQGRYSEDMVDSLTALRSLVPCPPANASVVRWVNAWDSGWPHHRPPAPWPQPAPEPEPPKVAPPVPKVEKTKRRLKL